MEAFRIITKRKAIEMGLICLGTFSFLHLSSYVFPSEVSYHGVSRVISTSGSYSGELALKMDELMNPFREDVADDCFCPNGRPNYLVYALPPRPAGIGDRHYVIHSLLKVADQICAKFIIQSLPKDLLGAMHGCTTSPDVSWFDYFVPYRRINGKYVMVDIMGEGPLDESQFPADTVQFGGRDVKDYAHARELYENGINFVWKISMEYYDGGLYMAGWPLESPKHREHTETCGEIVLGETKEQLEIASYVMNDMGLKSRSDYMSLHLRRGDTIWNGGCNNEPPAVIDYLNCYLCEEIYPKKMLVSTEVDPPYVQSLKEAWSQSDLSAMDIIVMEEYYASPDFITNLQTKTNVPQKYIDQFQVDNCYSYKVGWVIKDLSYETIERRRGCSMECNAHPQCFLSEEES